MSGGRPSPAPRLFLAAGAVVMAALAALVAPRAAYYLLPSAERPLHSAHAFLRSSGYGGLTFGLVGTAMMFLNLTYLLRKEFLGAVRLGSLRSWMAFHVFTGLIGATLVLLHSAFRPASALGILAFAALTVVVLTGLIGRFIYAHTPRSVEGRELELDDIRRRLETHRAELEKLGMPLEFFDRMRVAHEIRGTGHGVLRSLWGLVAGDRRLGEEARRLQALLHRHAVLQPMARTIVPLASRYARERQWLARYDELRSLMSGWRFLHRWFAVLMLATAGFHILVAVRLGRLWIFG